MVARQPSKPEWLRDGPLSIFGAHTKNNEVQEPCFAFDQWLWAISVVSSRSISHGKQLVIPVGGDIFNHWKQPSQRVCTDDGTQQTCTKQR
jgi:hypothetical protein